MSFFKTKIKIDEEALSIIEMTALTTLGYLVGKNNRDYIDDMESWYALFQGTGELIDVQETYKHGLHRLIEDLTDDKFLQLQIENTMSLLKIDIEGPQIPEELKRYRKIVDSFMSGVKTAKE